MPRVAITKIALGLNGAKDATTHVDIDAASGHKLTITKDRKVIVIASNSAVAEKDLTIKAGIGPEAGQGDLVVPVAAAGKQVIGPFESSRFKQADGDIYIDVEAAMTGEIVAIVLP